MTTDDGLIRIVYNGEVYNFAAERARLEAGGVRFRSSSDTEVVLRLYERHGDDFVLRLRGMFAVAVYDARRGPGSSGWCWRATTWASSRCSTRRRPDG
jgi:asparagine synthase (glutamine-hydrolysing)